jgi:hypothetical protein
MAHGGNCTQAEMQNMLSNTRGMLREIECAVDALRDRAWRPSDAVLADTLYTLGDAIAELDRLMLQLHRELVQRHPADTPESGSPLPLPNGEDLARSDSVHRSS